VILMALRWYLAHPLSGSSVMGRLAERGVDVSSRSFAPAGATPHDLARAVVAAIHALGTRLTRAA
jgi:hypothetical protein